MGTPLVLVLPDADPDAADEAVDQLVRIGFDRLVGVLDGGIERWAAAGRPIARMEALTSAELADELLDDAEPTIVDVRDPDELRSDGRVSAAKAIPLAELIEGDDLAIPPGAAVTVACKSGIARDGRGRPARGARGTPYASSCGAASRMSPPA